MITRYEYIDFLEWAKKYGYLQFPESRKIDMVDKYIESNSINELKK